MKTETERRLDAALAEAEALSHIIDVRTRALEAAEAEVARLTAEKDKIGDANCAVKMRLQLQVEALTAEKERALTAYDRMNAERIEERDKAFAAEALVEAGLGLADEWERLANLASGSMPVSVALRGTARELRATMGVTS